MSSKKKILFVNAPIQWIGRKMAVYPLGIAHVATYAARAGHDVDVIDLNQFDDHLRALDEALAEKKWDIVGVGLRSMIYFNQSQFPEFHRVVDRVAAGAPAAKIVCGGNGFSLYARQTMEKNRNIKAGVIGEGEAGFMELIESDFAAAAPGTMLRQGDEVIAGPVREILLDPTDVVRANREWRRADARNYHFANFNGKRGCGYRCFYCPAPNLHGCQFRVKSEEQIRDEIRYLQDIEVKRIYVTDSVFNTDRDYNEIFYQEFARKPIVWGAMLRPETFDRETVENLRKTRAEYIAFSIDSASEKILKIVNNDCNLADVETSLELLKGYPSKFITYTFIVGFPEETLHDVYLTAKMMRRIRKLGFNVSLEALDVIPKTPMMDLYEPDMTEPFKIYDWKWRWFPLGIRMAVKFKTVDPTVW